MNDAFKILIMHVDTFGVWRFSIFFGVFGMLCYFAKFFADKMGWLVGFSWLYFTTSALCQVELPVNRYGDLTSAFMQTGGQTFCELFVVSIFMLLSRSRARRIFLLIFSILIAIENILVWWKGYGLMNQTSFDTALIAVFLPFSGFYLFCFSLATIIFHHGTTALIILIAQIFGMDKNRAFTFMIPIVSIVFIIARFHNGDFTLNGSERLETYVHFMRDWWSSGWFVRLCGTGSGSFMWISIVTSNFKPPLFLQLHSDWLQVMFENGIVGLGLILAMFVHAIKKVYARPIMLATVLGFGAFALTYHPLRFFPSMVLCSFVFSGIFRKDVYENY